MLIASFWAFFFLPETKGRTLEEMDVLFGYTSDQSYHNEVEAAAKAAEKETAIEHSEARV